MKPLPSIVVCVGVAESQAAAQDRRTVGEPSLQPACVTLRASHEAATLRRAARNL